MSAAEAPDRVVRPMPQWWLILLSGIVAVIAGIVAVAVPGITLLVLGLFLGISLIVTGIGSILVGVTAGDNPGAQVLAVLIGFISVAAGLFCIARPGAGILAVLFSVAFWFVLTGVGDLAIAYRHPEHRVWHAVLGVIGVVAGIVLLANPGVGLSTVALLAGIGFLLRGATEIVLALQTRRLEEALRPR
jgi:uncharacterized membrane protein HdeD (DUF308 family)